jgi:hypothetical protein
MARTSREGRACATPYGKSGALSRVISGKMGQLYRMAEEVGFLRYKSGGGRGGELARRRSPRRADDPSHGPVTREVLDVACYITDVTAQLQALAIAANLDRLVYFLGMAKAESELLVRVSGVPEAERAEDESHEPSAGLHHENNSVD